MVRRISKCYFIVKVEFLRYLTKMLFLSSFSAQEIDYNSEIKVSSIKISSPRPQLTPCRSAEKKLAKYINSKWVKN